MGSPDRVRGRMQQDFEEDVEVNIDIVRDDDDDGDGYGKSKPRSNKSRKFGNTEEFDGLDGSGRKRSDFDRHESRKRVSGSSKAAVDQDDYEARKESRKQVKKKPEENMLDKLSTWYQDGEEQNKFDGAERSGSRGYSRAEDSEKKKSTSKYSEHNADVEKKLDRELKYTERRDSGRERRHGSVEHGRSSRKKWDESANTDKTDEYAEKSDPRTVNISDPKREDVSSDDRSKGRDDSWGDRNRDRDNSKDSWKLRQDKETRDGDSTYDSGRDWESRRRRDWPEGDSRYHGRSVGRKDGNRTEAVKTSSKYGISNDNYDVIEINTKSFDYVREDSRSAVVKNTESVQQPDSKLAPEVDDVVYSRDPRSRSKHGSIQSAEDANDRFTDGGGPSKQDQHPWRDDNDFQTEKSKGLKGVEGNREVGGQSSTSGSLPPYGNQESGSYSRNASQGVRGNRMGRGGRGRATGRDGQQSAAPMPIAGSPFGPLGMPPPGPMQSLGPNMSPAPGPPISPGVLFPPFQHPIVWPGGRGMEMNLLAVPQGLPPVPPGPLGPRFPPNMGNQPNGSLFSPSGPVRGMPPSISGPNYNTIVPAIRGQSQDKIPGGWVPPRTNIPPGKAPSRGEQNDYSQNFVDTGMRPQNYIRELELTSVVEDYPKLRELIQRKDEIVAKSASSPMYYKCDLREQVLSPEFFGTKFDVILVDPPWEEYVHRAPGVTDHMEHWSFEEIMNLKIESIADTPSFIFLWVGDGVGLEQGRQCLKKWGFRRCEDICWVKTNKTNATPGLRHDSLTLYQRTKEHCLMGIKGTVRRSTDGHIIHANIDTDVIIAEEPPYGSTAKPEDMYRIIEHFALGRRRLELFGEDHNIRSGWLTVGNGLTSSNFNSEQYVRNFADKDGKVWLGGGGRNPPPEAPHLALTTPEIESLRPKSPMKNQQQLAQQPSAAISLTTPTSGNKRPTGNSPQHHIGPMNQEGSSSSMPSPAPWASSPMVRDSSHMPGDERFDMYAAAYSTPFGPGGGDFFDYESHRGMNMM